MMLRSWRRHLVLVFLLVLQVLALEAGTQWEDPESGKSSLPSEDDGSDASDLGNAPALKVEQASHGDADGQPAVDAALNILQNLKITKTKYSQPSGFLGHARHYAREAFYLLFMNAPPAGSHTQTRTEKMNPQLRDAVHLLDGAANENNPNALFMLGEMNFYGNYTHPRNYSKAFEHYQTLEKLTGNSTAQYMLGFMYATGFGEAVERHQGKALLYHTFAAMGGNTRSQMTLAYRRYTGIGAARDCDQAAFYYQRVADKAIQYYRSGPPGGRTLTREGYRWADDEGGVYGEGASVSSAGINAIRDGHHASSDASLGDVLEYLDLLTKKGDVKATFSLGKMYYEGSRHLERNFRKAMSYFGGVAKRYWSKDGKVNPSHPVGIEKLASKAAGHIGLMFLRGEGTEQNFDKAAVWFRKGIANGDPSCQHYMGLMYLHGYGVPQDAVKAASYFKASSEQDFAAAEVRLGALFLDQGDVATAARYFELAARYGGIEPFYYLAELADQGLERERHCGVATAYYKMVAEKAEAVHSSFVEANLAYENGDKETALAAAMMAAEQGYENAQANVAFLLDEQRSVVSLDPVLPWTKAHRPSILKDAALALIYWTRSAKQNNIDSMVKMGDYYLNGYGTPVDIDKASSCYHSAAEGHHSAQAFWDIGWLYENGLSVDQDFHMAKRYYDLALETNDEAYLPVKLSLLRLRIRGFWNGVTHGKANPIRSEPEEDDAPRSLKEWIAAFINYDDDESLYAQYHQDGHPDDDGIFDDQGSTGGADGSYYDDLDLDVDDGILESLIIIGLAITFVVLVQLRQRALRRARADANQGAQNNNQQGGQAGNGNGGGAQRQGEDRGLFPRPDDPNFAAWVGGGVGH